MTKNYAAKTLYFGATAQEYDAIREAKSAKYEQEQLRISEFLVDLPTGSRILDAPIGTGRFLTLYAERGFDVVGIDISKDMISQARAKAEELGLQARLLEADALKVPLPDKSVDYIVCHKFVKWLPDPSHLSLFFKELSRLADKGAIVEIKIEDKRVKLLRQVAQLSKIGKPRIRRYYLEEIVKACQDANLDIARIVPLGISGHSSYYLHLTNQQ